MDYNDLVILAKQRKILQKDICEELKLTSAGFKRGFENGSLSIKNLIALCRLIQISPDEVLGWPHEETAFGGNYASHITGGNTQNSNDAIKALNDQLKEKDKQIDRLLKIIEKNK